MCMYMYMCIMYMYPCTLYMYIYMYMYIIRTCSSGTSTAQGDMEQSCRDRSSNHRLTG